MQDRKNTSLDRESAGTSTSQSVETNSHPSYATSRRGFLKTAGMGAAALTASAMVPSILEQKAEAIEIGPPSSGPQQRGNELEKIRKAAAKAARDAEVNSFPHPTNGDEERYANQSFAGNFSKTLPHDPATGLVIPSAYQSLLNALTAGTQEAFDAVPAGGTGKLAGPLSPLQFQMQG